MKNLFQMVTRPSSSARDTSLNPITLQDWATMFQYNGQQYITGAGPSTTLGVQKQEMGADFQGYINNAYKANGIVFAAMLTRLNTFSEARFQFRGYNKGRPGKLFGTQALDILETPWQNGTTGDLLTKAIVDVDVAGNFYCVHAGDHLRRLRPDWVTIVLGSKSAVAGEDLSGPEWDAEPIGYLYSEGGLHNSEPVYFSTEEMCHWAPIPDLSAKYRGMSWLTPITNEILGDKATTAHKLKFFEHGATPNIIISLSPEVKGENFKTWVELMRTGTEGLDNAYKTLYLGGGATGQVVGTNLQQLDFRNVQAYGETRIAAAAGVPPIIMGIAEGLRSATYSNYVQARRSFADGTLRPLWRSISASMQSIITIPPGAHLWYDDRDIPLIKQDLQDQATIQLTQASVLASLIASGYTPESAIEALLANDMALLDHTGLTSVQLQPPGEGAQAINPPSNAPPGPVDKSGRDDPLLYRLLEARRLALESGE